LSSACRLPGPAERDDTQYIRGALPLVFDASAHGRDVYAKMVSVENGNSSLEVADKALFGDAGAVPEAISVQKNVPADGASLSAQEKVATPISVNLRRIEIAVPGQGRPDAKRPIIGAQISPNAQNRAGLRVIEDITDGRSRFRNDVDLLALVVAAE
jgi:hypothetical protein